MFGREVKKVRPIEGSVRFNGQPGVEKIMSYHNRVEIIEKERVVSIPRENIKNVVRERDDE